MNRIETDFLGEMEIPKDALYGISTLRSIANFPNSKKYSFEWYKAIGEVKYASYLVVKDLYLLLQAKNKLNEKKIFNEFSIEKIDALIFAAFEVSRGRYFDHMMVPAITGGAGTSINMNINEIISNIALLKMGYSAGEYKYIDPILHANVFQSTNDTIPTALRVAVMRLLKKLESNISQTRNLLEKLEEDYRHTMRISYTQLQEAIPTTWGRLFSTYNEALTRDWWRVSKCWERIKVVNLGGGAIGSGLSIPRYFIFHATEKLAKQTNLPIVRSENLQDVTCNLDMWVEIHAILKANAVNLIKIASDLRLLASDFHKNHEITIPTKQMGSTIMPGKVNPVICEYVISISEKIFANDLLIAHLCSQGQFELNAYLPLIGDTIIESLELLNSSLLTINKNLINEIKINPILDTFLNFPVIATIVIPEVGYHEATRLANFMKNNQVDIIVANQKLNIIDETKLIKLIENSKSLELGYSLAPASN